MTEIKFWGITYIGTTDGDHGVFTDPDDGAVYAGEIVRGSACVGVNTRTNGTDYVECDAGGIPHGRYLECDADGYTWYHLYEHGSEKEWALLAADGGCCYDGEECRADYAPFVALQAKVLPIKARPHQRPHSRPYAAFSAPTAPPIGPIGRVLALAEVGNDPRRQGARSSASAIGLRAPCDTPAVNQMHRASNLDDAPAEGCTALAARPHA